jgi:hypothetical protein
MDLMPDDIRARLLANGATPEETDHLPVVKYFDPCGAATWIITGLMPPEDRGEGEGAEPDILFGLCDLGMGCPELGYVSLSELRSVTAGLVSGSSGLSISKHAGRSRSTPTPPIGGAASSSPMRPCLNPPRRSALPRCPPERPPRTSAAESAQTVPAGSRGLNPGGVPPCDSPISTSIA